NRVFVASCSPRTHESLFQQTVQEVGLNKYLFEMANIRDQCSWVHAFDPEKATEKAKDLVRMGLTRAFYLKPLHSSLIDVVQKTLIIGGGLAGMTAALSLANQGFETYLVEKQAELGGNLRDINHTIEGKDVKVHLNSLIEEVERNPSIRVYRSTRIKEIDGCIGDFRTTICNSQGEESLNHGAVIVATGAAETRTDEYLYGDDSRVLTQRDLEQLIYDGSEKIKDLKCAVMIQCVGSRNGERPYCSRICCTHALKNALRIKEINPGADVYILYRDIMSYGFKEKYYTMAREANIKFIRYNLESPPQVEKDGGSLKVSVIDRDLGSEIQLQPDVIGLSVPIIPEGENENLSRILKVPLDSDGFFLEAHMKLRPVDFSTDGIFVCGMAHSPKFIEETIIQAKAAAARVAALLSKEKIESEAMVPVIDLDRCIGCGICEATCAFGAIKVMETEKGKRAQVIKAACKGCGTCGAACPELANVPGHFTDQQLIAQITAFGDSPRPPSEKFEPRILGFLCNWCSYVGADIAGISRIQYKPNLRIVRVMCSGRIDPSLVIEAFLHGIDGVVILGCHPGDCHYTVGNLLMLKRMDHLRRVMQTVGLDQGRFRVDWVSAAEGLRFSEIVNEFTENVRTLGPIDSHGKMVEAS
ncbi:MAG: hydrogenase iron-sulfur subunit, partial [Fidelibacterota bacterium]